jgi:hypothetical protein
MERSFTTPTFRLSARAANLPGGFKLGTGLRISHRSSTDSAVRPVTSTRVYQVDLEKRFDRIPLELHLGRFYNRFEAFSGFWDGLLFRFGPRAFGGGLAIGFEPEYSNEGLDSQRPKLSGFVDFEARGEVMDYSGSLSFLGVRPRNGLPDRTVIGVSHRLQRGRAWIQHRLEVDRDATGSDWNVTRFQLDGSLDMGRGLTGFAGWRRWRAVPLWAESATLGPQEDRAHVGFSYWGSLGGGSVDYALARPEIGSSSHAISGSFHLAKTPIPNVGLGGVVSRWSRADGRSLLLAPEIRVTIGSVDFRGSFRHYRTEINNRRATTYFSDLGLFMPLSPGVRLRLQGSTQFSGDLSSTRLFASLSKGF